MTYPGPWITPPPELKTGLTPHEAPTGAKAFSYQSPGAWQTLIETAAGSNQNGVGGTGKVHDSYLYPVESTRRDGKIEFIQLNGEAMPRPYADPEWPEGAVDIEHDGFGAYDSITWEITAVPEYDYAYTYPSVSAARLYYGIGHELPIQANGYGEYPGRPEWLTWDYQTIPTGETSLLDITSGDRDALTVLVATESMWTLAEPAGNGTAYIEAARWYLTGAHGLYRPPAYRFIYDGSPPGGMWNVRQNHSEDGVVGGWPARSWPKTGRTGSWPRRSF